MSCTMKLPGAFVEVVSVDDLNCHCFSISCKLRQILQTDGYCKTALWHNVKKQAQCCKHKVFKESVIFNYTVDSHCFNHKPRKNIIN